MRTEKIAEALRRILEILGGQVGLDSAGQGDEDSAAPAQRAVGQGE